jgi:RNA polymerase sigma factor (sigma-70 family)
VGSRELTASQPPLQTDEDAEEVIAALLANESEALRKVTGWARSVIAHRVWGFESSDDIIQETLLALLRNFREGKFVGGDLRAYVRRIAKNLCISRHRKIRGRGAHIQLQEDDSFSSASGTAAAMECAAMVGRILRGLGDACRRLMVLAYVEGLSRREIAERLGISEAAAKVRLFRCLEMARAQQDVRPKRG